MQTKLFRRDFTLVVIGQIISLFGNAVLRFALPLYLLRETGSSTLFGVVTACSFAPMVILSMVGGVLADRVNKRNIMVGLDFSTAAIIMLFYFSLGKIPTVPLFIVVLMLLYGISGTYQPAVQANDAGYHNYGERGIRFSFPNVTEAGLYLIRTYGLPDREMEIDRINNDMDYAPGNLRFVSHAENNGNKRCTVLSHFSQEYWPYARSVVIRKLSQGMTRDEIIQDAEDAVFYRRKNWRIISARLDFMTYEMPDHITVLPYRENSSITVGTEAALVR